MVILNLKPTHKVITTYYNDLAKLAAQTKGNVFKEGAVSPLFAPILRHCASQFNRLLIEQYTLDKGHKNLFLDGAIVDSFNLIYGIWEAKDDDDKLEKEVIKKFHDGYPKDNILFQSPKRAILWQNGQCVLDRDVSQPSVLVDVLKAFFEYEPPVYQEWNQAVEEFKDRVKEIGKGFLTLIEQERKSKNTAFIKAFEDFIVTCRDNINPNISIQAVEEMLIQHLLTERIFRKIFNNPDFANLNIVAREIEKVILALVTPHGGRTIFFQPLDRFYHAIESTASSTHDFSEKQAFLNTVYEKFFQGFSVKVADTHGIVYTPQEVVKFMVRSVEDMLQAEFGRSLSDQQVHILDPFVGTGNFIVQVMRTLKKTALRQKYEQELHCNEVMLLPYYVATMNIEHEYYAQTGEYKPFTGACFADTFQLAEPRQAQFTFMTEENTSRVKRQKETTIFVIVGNPPYNAGQINENDNNKNRKYPVIDQQISETYAKDSQATLLRKLNDPYVKAIRWASNRIEREGVVAFVTNSSFIEDLSFDGMRKHLAQDFHRIYIVDLKGNVRKDSMREGFPIGEKHTVFGLSAMVGVAMTFFIKNPAYQDHKIYYSSVDWRATRQEKFAWLASAGTYKQFAWKELMPDENATWLTEGLDPDFNTFLPMGSKTARSSKSPNVHAIFKTFSLGVSTNRDRVVYDFDRQALAERVQQFSERYNLEVLRYQQKGKPQDIDNFINYENIQWSSTLKEHLKRGTFIKFDAEKIRTSSYRPFAKKWLYYDSIVNDRPAMFQKIFPDEASEQENQMIGVVNEAQLPFSSQMTHCIPNMHWGGRQTQCFPFYTYHEDGSHRTDNVTDWAVAQFQAQYQDASISKWDIFYYVYGVLHHPEYRKRYEANLKRDLPHIPYLRDFRAFSDAGKQLAALHSRYEEQAEYPLTLIENPDVPLDWRVERMRLSRDKTTLVYNDFLTFTNLPADAFAYKIGNKSALHWIIDQYQVTKDESNNMISDPNQADEPEYIVKLVKKIVTVSIETVKIVRNLPEFVILR
ncbi:hypothetical protein U14_00661 [Candidatus Moduliflexus flocculans]|uniref:site-specific DNA-methyltransferase (adenine-specific) n=1 Tax=Candidatus Moduliflexus flocculans TaxID=1499966 RepID=A0A0S6VUJ2_9BACT|nr:hypothetical protein U14_00661 [Candidatus Moduliflexus flocculans]